MWAHRAVSGTWRGRGVPVLVLPSVVATAQTPAGAPADQQRRHCTGDDMSHVAVTDALQHDLALGYICRSGTLTIRGSDRRYLHAISLPTLSR